MARAEAANLGCRLDDNEDDCDPDIGGNLRNVE